MAGLLDFLVDIPCVKQMRFDPMPTASVLEAALFHYLIPPPEGFYFRNRAEPVMRKGEVYHQHKLVNGKKSKETYVIQNFNEIDKNMPIMDLDANVIVTPTQFSLLEMQPALPVTALAIVEEAVRDVVESHGMEEYRRKPIEPMKLYGRFFDARIQHDEALKEVLVDQIMETVSGIRSDVRSFCGENPWVIHFLRKRHLDLIVDKSVDWRLIDFHNRNGTKLEHYE
jgi:hypothetical protein